MLPSKQLLRIYKTAHQTSPCFCNIYVVLKMPRVLARDPVWLSRSAPGFSLFQPEPEGKSKVVPENEHDGPLRKIAHRGTEIFVAVGKELRWSDLGLLKDAGEELGRHHGRRTEDQLEDGRGYRVSTNLHGRFYGIC